MILQILYLYFIKYKLHEWIFRVIYILHLIYNIYLLFYYLYIIHVVRFHYLYTILCLKGGIIVGTLLFSSFVNLFNSIRPSILPTLKKISFLSLVSNTSLTKVYFTSPFRRNSSTVNFSWTFFNHLPDTSIYPPSMGQVLPH